MSVELREYKIDFAQAFALIKNNPKILDNGYDKTPNPFTLKDAIDLFTGEMSKTPAQRFLIFYNNDLAGEIGITLKDDVFRLNAEIGYFIAEKFWGKGLATEAIRRMSEYAFATFNINRIMAGVFEFNKSSMRALEKNDFYLESRRRKVAIKNGKVIDDYIFVKMREE